MKPEQHNYEILFLLFADTHRAGSFGKCLPREECRTDATHFSIIFASDGNWPNYRTVHYFWYITWVRRCYSLGFLSQLRPQRIAHDQMISTQNKHAWLVVVQCPKVHTWTLSLLKNAAIWPGIKPAP